MSYRDQRLTYKARKEINLAIQEERFRILSFWADGKPQSMSYTKEKYLRELIGMTI